MSERERNNSRKERERHDSMRVCVREREMTR